MIRGFGFEIKELTEAGEFSGYASVYGVEDLVGDVVEPGAFAKTLSADGRERPLLWSHKDPIGKIVLTDTAKGLQAAGKLSLGISTAKDVHAMLRDKIVQGLSIGFETIRSKDVNGVRHLQEVRLWEVSLVTFPACQEALVTGVKSPQQQEQITRALHTFRTDVIRALEKKQ